MYLKQFSYAIIFAEFLSKSKGVLCSNYRHLTSSILLLQGILVSLLLHNFISEIAYQS